MQSTVAIYNTALARLGGHQLERVNSPDDDGAAATLCRTLFPHAVDMTLASADWSFATRRAALARKADAGPTDYPFRYGLPSDCLNPLRLEGEIRDHCPPNYIIEGNDLLTVVEEQYAVLDKADCLAVVTEWNQFRNPDFSRIKATLKAPIIFDGRNLYSPQLLADLGLAYFCIGRPAPTL